MIPADSGKLNLRGFAQQATTAILAALGPDWRTEPADDLFTLRLVRSGADAMRMTIHLGRFFRMYRQPGTRLADVLAPLRDLAAGQQGLLDMDSSWDAVAPRLRIQLAPSGTTGVQESWRGTLVTRLVIDYPDIVRVVLDAMLTDWGVDRAAAFAQAHAQTRAALAATHDQTVQHGSTTIHLWGSPVGYVASRLCYPELLRRDVGHADACIIAAPARDVVLAAPTDTPPEVLAILIMGAMNRQSHLLAPEQLFILQGTTIRPMAEAAV